MNAARVEAFGRWQLVGSTMTLYAADGVTIVHTFPYDAPLNPTQRT